MFQYVLEVKSSMQHHEGARQQMAKQERGSPHLLEGTSQPAKISSFKDDKWIHERYALADRNQSGSMKSNTWPGKQV